MGDGDGDDLLQFPVPAGCQNRVSGPRLGFLVAAEQRNSSWKNVEPPVFSGQGLYIVRRRGRGGARRSHMTPTRSQGGPRLGMVWAPHGSSPSHLQAP